MNQLQMQFLNSILKSSLRKTSNLLETVLIFINIQYYPPNYITFTETNEGSSQTAGWTNESDLLVLNNVQHSKENANFQNAYIYLMLEHI